MIRLFVILLFACPALPRAAHPTIVTVSPQDVRQEFQGMGCGAIFYEAHITSLGRNGHPEKQAQLYDDIFTKVRTDFLQLQIRHDHEPKNDNDDPYIQAFDPKDFAYCEHPLEISAAAKKRNPNMKLYAVLYTPPPWMKTNNDASGGGKNKATIKPGLELEVGEYIWAFLAHMQKHGQPIDYLSISNEADWGHDQPGYFLTTGQHTHLFVKIAEYLDEMSRRNPEVPSPKLVAPNMLSAVDTANHSLPALLAAAADQVDVVGNHDYDRRGHRWAKMREVAGTKPLWMTEACFNGVDKSPGLINSAGEYWLYMTEAFNEGVNVWMAYDWVYPPRQGGEALIHLNWGKSYHHTKIYHGFRQWCAPLVPGMRVVDCKVSGPFATGISKPGIKASSFLSADKSKLVIHVAAVQDPDADIEIRIAAPFADAPFRMWRTAREDDFAELPSGRATNGRITTRLPGRGLLTVSLERSNTNTETKPSAAVPEAAGKRLDGGTPEERGLALVRHTASLKPKDELFPKAAAPAYAARLLLNVDTDYALTKLDAAVTSRITMAKDRFARQAEYDAAKDKSKLKRPGPALDPFDKAALVHTYFIGKTRIPKSTALKIRDYVALWGDHRQLTGYARGAWNYKLMMDASGYLAAEEWPELVDREGLDARQIREATRKRLFDGFHEIATRNFSEYGAPIYLGVNLCALRMLADFARDDEMRKRAAMTLDAMFLDIACTWNQGNNAGTASRAKYWGSTDTGPEAMASTGTCAWLAFGAPRSISTGGLGEIHALWMAVPGKYRCPEPIMRVANRRLEPFLHTSHVAAMGKANVHRMTWHTPDYSLCSQWDQPGDPTSGLYKESRRHMLKWISDKPSSTFAVCMENPARPYALRENRANALGYGENGFAQYMQDEGTLLGLYSVPEKVKVRNHEFDYPYHKLYAPFPATGSIVKRIESDGWILCHNGSMLMAFRSIKPCKWGKKWGTNDMLWCEARRNGWVLETSRLEPFAGGGVDAELGRFAAALKSHTSLDTTLVDRDPPAMTYRNLAGRTMEFQWQPHKEPYADHLRIDGKPLVFDSTRLHHNPVVRQQVGGPLQIRDGNTLHIWDFESWQRKTRPIDRP